MIQLGTLFALLIVSPAFAVQSCTNNGIPGACQNGSKCKLNDKGLIYCDGCDRTKYSGFRCQTPIVSTQQSCANNGTPGACQNGSKCKLNNKGLIYCEGCDRTKYSGFRCEIPVKPSSDQSCANNGTPGPCQNGSKCKLNNVGLIYCDGCDRTKFSGFRCEIPVKPSSGQSCTNNGTPGPCQNGSKCKLNNVGLIYCDGCDRTKFSGDRCDKSVTPPAGGCPPGQIKLTATYYDNDRTVSEATTPQDSQRNLGSCGDVVATCNTGQYATVNKYCRGINLRMNGVEEVCINGNCVCPVGTFFVTLGPGRQCQGTCGTSGSLPVLCDNDSAIQACKNKVCTCPDGTAAKLCKPNSTRGYVGSYCGESGDVYPCGKFYYGDPVAPDNITPQPN